LTRTGKSGGADQIGEKIINPQRWSRCTAQRQAVETESSVTIKTLLLRSLLVVEVESAHCGDGAIDDAGFFGWISISDDAVNVHSSLVGVAGGRWRTRYVTG